MGGSVILPLAADAVAPLRLGLEALEARLARIADTSELRALAARLERELDARRSLRAALVAASPRQVAAAARVLAEWLAAPPRARLSVRDGAILARVGTVPRVGVLAPGQGSPVRVGAGALAACCRSAARIAPLAELGSDADVLPLALVQLALVESSLTGLMLLDALRLPQAFALGHSLGELVALHWAGALDRATLRRLARARGRAMVEQADGPGAMASVLADAAAVDRLIERLDVAIACRNAPEQAVVSGPAASVELVVRRARAAGVRAVRLDVSGAFHSRLMLPAAAAFAAHVRRVELGPVRRPVISSVTGGWLDAETDLRALLVEQLTAPVRFVEAVRVASGAADLMVEVGSGRVLAGLVAASSSVPVISLRVGERTTSGLLELVAVMWACGRLPRPALPATLAPRPARTRVRAERAGAIP